MEGYTITEPRGDGVAVVQFPALAAFSEIRHGYSTREGGVSEGIFASMNLGFARGDDDDRVRENFRRIFAALGIPEGAEVFTKQTHTTNVRVAVAEDCGTGIGGAGPAGPGPRPPRPAYRDSRGYPWRWPRRSW